MGRKLKYNVIKYDNLSFEGDPERPGHSRSYDNPDVNAPLASEKYFDDKAEVEGIVAALNADLSKRSETIDITLANGQHYVGPRFTYVVGEVMANEPDE